MTTQAQAAPAGGRGLTVVGQVQDALGRLRHVDCVDTLLERAVIAACDGCGLDRAVLLRLDGSVLVAEAVHVSDAPDAARLLLEELRAAPLALAHGLVETDLVPQPAAMRGDRLLSLLTPACCASCTSRPGRGRVALPPHLRARRPLTAGRALSPPARRSAVTGGRGTP